MRNKPRNWTDVQLIISSISIAFTLGFWSLLASRGKAVVGVAGDASMPTQPDGAVPSGVASLVPGQVILLGGASTQTPAPLVVQSRPARRREGSGGGSGGAGGGGGGAAASTKSS